jgi:4-diphosphocytidyl-2-C-methyl-D-erythritol kinase
MALQALYDLPAPAKINLFLHVVGRRADGYHELQSVFVPIDWADTLHLERRDDGLLRRHDLGTPLPAEDLCLGAARALQRASGTSLGADIHVDKHVPAGAGMGGGSSDAATTLIGLNRLWGLGWSRHRLADLALAVGADVPFFVHGRGAWVQGIGDRITPLALPSLRLAVLKPTASLPTAAIFGASDLVRDTERAILQGFPGSSDHGGVSVSQIVEGFGHNDLEAVARRLEPQVQQALALMHQAFGNSRMTGSGSAVFSRVGADVPSSVAIPSDLPAGWVGRMCRSLEAHPLVDWTSD